MRHSLCLAVTIAVLTCGVAGPVRADDPVPVPLDIKAAFNTDAWCGPKEFQECLTQDQDWGDLAGGLPEGNGFYVLAQGSLLAGNTAGEAMAYSLPGEWYHPQNLSGTEGTPQDGVLVGSAFRIYHIASAGGNGTLMGNWLEVADPTTYTLKSNCIVVGSNHSTADWQVSEVIVELPGAQKTKYTDINLVLAAMDRSDLARNMAIYALYGDGTDEVLLYSFSTDEGGSGPAMTDNAGGADFNIVYTMTKGYSASSGSHGSISDTTASLYEFKTAPTLDSAKILYGFKVVDTNPSLNWNSRGLAVFAATATPLVASGANVLPVADAGEDQLAVDDDWSGDELVQLDGTGSYDTDGAVVGYDWQEGGLSVATGPAPEVTLAVGIHTLTLIVTDNAGGTDSDTVVINVSERPSGTYYVDQSTGDDDNYPGTEALPFATIGHATALALPGDTIIVKAGIYRESPPLTNSGQAGNPITLTAATGERVVVSGADRLTGWTQCDATTAKGNPNAANIYYVDIAYKPARLAQDEYDLQKARVPNDGWYICEGGDVNTMTDTANLTGPDDYWVGAEIFFWDTNITAQYQRDIINYDSATQTITVDKVWNSTQVPEAGKDRYYLMNKVELIDGEGDWVAEDLNGDGSLWRVYLWANGGGNPDGAMIEASRPGSFVIGLGTRSYWIFDGLEIRHGAGHGIGTWSSGGDGHNTIQNCSIHHNGGTGIYGRYNDYSVYRNNFVAFNDYGMTNGGSSYVTIEGNEVCRNGVDGILTTGPGGTEWATGVIVRGNYIHDQYKWGHPDNAQSYNNIRNLLVEDNLFLHAVQSYMMEGTEDTTFRNNVIIGAAAYSVILGHGNTLRTTFDSNTLMFSGYGLVNQSGSGYYYTNNLVIKGHDGSVWGGVGDGTYVEDDTDYTSDYNVFWHGPGITSTVVVWNRNWSLPWANYVSQSGQDTHSYYADPMLTNVPAYFSALDSSKQDLFTATRVYMRTDTIGLFQVGDHIEINWDGTLRTITAIGADYVEFTPGDSEFTLKADQIANWKTKTDLEFNMTPLPGSPIIGNADDGGNIGSDIDVVDYMAGDFNGDGTRDIPVWPYEQPSVPTLEITATLDGDWVYQNTDNATGNRHTRTLTVTITGGEVTGETYQATLAEAGGPVTHFQITQPVVLAAATVDIPVAGGNLDTTTPTSPAAATLTVTVTGLTQGQVATAEVTLELRRLGNINGDAVVDTEDKLYMNQFLNGLPVAYPAENLDLNADTVVDTADKLLLNQMLNGIAIP